MIGEVLVGEVIGKVEMLMACCPTVPPQEYHNDVRADHVQDSIRAPRPLLWLWG